MPNLIPRITDTMQRAKVFAVPELVQTKGDPAASAYKMSIYSSND